jgi:hypothetical protein
MERSSQEILSPLTVAQYFSPHSAAANEIEAEGSFKAFSHYPAGFFKKNAPG